MTTPGALSPIRVLDLSRILAGPWATQILADLGAEVIKVERPGAGDDTRGWGPPHFGVGADREAAYFLSTNRGKKSVTIDITQPEGQALVRRLAAESDVVIENFKVGGLKKYGLDYESLSQACPRLIYCSITGFGQTGPYSHRPGYDLLIQALGGLMSVTGEADDRPGGGPMKVGVALADVLTGLYAVIGVQAALTSRERSGEGQHIDLALLDVEVACLANQAMNYLVSGRVPQRMGNAHPNIVPYQAFATQDGYIILAVGNDQQFRRFCVVAGVAELADEPRFASNDQRVANRDELIPQLEAVIGERSNAFWLEALEREGVPCGPINHLDQVFDDPQIAHRGLRREVETPLGVMPQIASPLRLAGTPPSDERPPPRLGADTREVLGGLLGLDDDELESLQAQDVI